MKRRFFSVLVALFALCFSLPALAAETYSDFSFGMRDGAMAFTAKTTLPDGSIVGVWIHQTTPKPKALYSAVPLDYPKNMDPIVKGGEIQGVFDSTRKYGLPKGRYEIVFTFPATGTNTQQHRLRITTKDDIPAQGE